MKRGIRWIVMGILLALVFPLLLLSGRGEMRAAALGEEAKTLRILVLGKDRSAGLTDSMFLFAVSEADGRASVLQIPRDTYAEYTTKDYRKINGALSCLGAGGLVNFLSRSLGIPIDGYVILELSTLREMVDAVGGVEVEIGEDLVYSDPAQDLEIRLPRGRVHLDGTMAEQFVRFRAGYANADLGRLDAQKQFLRAFVGRVRELSPIQRAQLLLTSELPKTDLTLPDLLSFSDGVSQLSAESIEMATLPGEAVRGVSGAWYFSLCREGAIRALARYMFLDEEILRSKFDPDGVFDRTENDKFHKIYTAPLKDGGA